MALIIHTCTQRVNQTFGFFNSDGSPLCCEGFNQLFNCDFLAKTHSYRSICSVWFCMALWSYFEYLKRVIQPDTCERVCTLTCPSDWADLDSSVHTIWHVACISLRESALQSSKSICA